MKKSKEERKNTILGTIIIIVFIAIVFFACSGRKKDKTETTPAETTTAPAAEPISAPEPVSEPEPVSDTAKEQEFIDFTRQTLAQNGLSCTVELQGNILVINMYSDSMASDILNAVLGDEAALVSWESLKESAVAASESLRNAAVREGLDHIHPSIMIMNPVNKENAILITMDNIIYYDGMEEMRAAMEQKQE